MKQENTLTNTGSKYLLICWEDNSIMHIPYKIDYEGYILYKYPKDINNYMMLNYFDAISLMNQSIKEDKEFNDDKYTYEIKEENEAREIINNYLRQNEI